MCSLLPQSSSYYLKKKKKSRIAILFCIFLEEPHRSYKKTLKKKQNLAFGTSKNYFIKFRTPFFNYLSLSLSTEAPPCRHRILYPLRLGPPFPNNARTLRPNGSLEPNQLLKLT